MSGRRQGPLPTSRRHRSARPHVKRLRGRLEARAGWVSYPSGMASRPVPAVLSIAGSDSGGGAGIQADLKAFARCGVHGMTAITALTAQSTVGVSAIHPVPGEFVIAQVRAVVEDIGVDAVKIGMLGTTEIVEAVEEALGLLAPGTPIVIDPVMVAESGAILLDDPARTAIVERLLPLATVITPNVPEARVLAAAGDPGAGADEAGAGAARAAGADDADDAEALARRLHALGPRVVVVTGGHREQAIDVLFDGERVELISGERYPDGAAHGSGCTHASVLAAHLALGHTPLEAARAARVIAGEAVRDGLRGLGAGPGPVDVLSLTSRARTAPSAGDVAAPLA
jgi:hydroxymethylpyrimidine/phosphomethylpyrimidine kinase